MHHQEMMMTIIIDAITTTQAVATIATALAALAVMTQAAAAVAGPHLHPLPLLRTQRRHGNRMTPMDKV